MKNFDTLRNGSRIRLSQMRRYRDDWNKKRETDSRAKYWLALAPGLAGALQARSHGIGAWKTGAHGLASAFAAMDAGDRAVAAPVELVAGWRDCGDVADILEHSRTYPGSYYCDADASETYDAHVWQLPARDGVPQYVAGYLEHQGSGYVVLEASRGALVLYDDKEDAARAADGLAERDAEREREYNERWQEASQQDMRRSTARDELKAARRKAREAIAALRELSPESRRAASLLHQLIDHARDDMREAIGTIADATDTIERLDMTGEF